MKFHRSGSLFLLFCCVTASAVAEEPDETLRFESDILPILESRCLACHGDADRQSDLDLRTQGQYSQRRSYRSRRHTFLTG